MDRVAAGKTNVVFVRAKENMRQSLGTVEISNTGNIVQARAAYNMPLPEDVMEFVKKLKDEVQRRIRKRGIGA